MRSYAVIGCGAIGGYYGARLQQAGCDVHFLLHSDYRHVRRRGLVIKSKDGNFRLPRVNAYDRPEDVPPCDYTIIALKSTQNGALVDLLPGVMRTGKGAAVLMQNGLNQEDLVATLVGPDRVMSGLCFVCSEKAGPGHVRHLDYGLVTLGDFRADHRPAGITGRMRLMGADLRRAGIPVQLAPDLWSARWQKLMWNIPFSGLTTLLQADTRKLLACSATELLAREFMEEVMLGARACGASMPKDFDVTMMARTRKMVPYEPSMSIDRRNRRLMEVEAMFGEPCRTARAAGTPLPKIEALYRLLSFINDTMARPGRTAPHA